MKMMMNLPRKRNGDVMGGITIDDIVETIKLITVIVAGCGSLGGVIAHGLKKFMAPINQRLDSIDANLTIQKNDIADVKRETCEIRRDLQELTNKHNDLEVKTAANRRLDGLLVKTLRIMLDESDESQKKMKSEIDGFLIDGAVAN